MTTSSAPRRFYAAVDVQPAVGGFAVTLDGRPAHTPGGRTLVLPTAALAHLVAAEWYAQAEQIDFAAMPATTLAYAVLDAPPAARAAWAESLAGFAAHDLLCYFADAPAALTRRQEAVWAPLLDWVRDNLGLEFHRTAGIVHIDQPPATLAAVRALAMALDDFSLAPLAQAARLTGSAILALGLARRRLNGSQALAAARLDETFQAEQWGEDAESVAIAAALAREAAMLEAWFAAVP